MKKAEELYYPGFVPLESRNKIRRDLSSCPNAQNLFIKLQ